MDTLIIITRVLIILTMIVLLGFSLMPTIINFGGIVKLRKIFWKINVFFFVLLTMTILLSNNPNWHEIKTNVFLFLCMRVFQLLEIRKLYEKLEEFILKGTSFKFHAVEETQKAVWGIVEVDGFWIEGFSEEFENFEKGKTYNDVSLFLEFDNKGRPRSLIVFR